MNKKEHNRCKLLKKLAFSGFMEQCDNLFVLIT